VRDLRSLAVHAISLHLFTSEHPWRWDLASLAAILTGAGTLALALYTAKLARSTRRLAAETGEDVRAEWRPVLIVDDAELRVEHTLHHGASVTGAVLNEGRGPALNVVGQVVSRTSGDARSTVIELAYVGVHGRVGFSAQDLLAEDLAEVGGSLAYEVVVTYEDLGGHRYETIQRFADPNLADTSATRTLHVTLTNVRDIAAT
jgi:hypothetical protein